MSNMLKAVVVVIMIWLGAPLAAGISNTPRADLPTVNGIVRAMTVVGDTLYIGGDFTSVGGLARNNLAAIDIDPASANYGQVLGWDPNVQGGGVYVMVSNGPQLYVGGRFTSVKGAPNGRLAFIDLVTGDPLTIGVSFDTQAGLTTTVYALALDGAKLYCGGRFDDINNGTTERQNLATIDLPRGTLDTRWRCPVVSALGLGSFQSGVHSLAVVGNNLYVGGWYTTMGTTAQTVRGVSVVNKSDHTTSPILSWHTPTGHIVKTMLVSGGKVYVSGLFTGLEPVAVPNGQQAGLESRYALAALNASNNTLDNWGPATVASGGGIYAMAEDQQKGVLYLGGNLATIDGQARANFAALDTVSGQVTDDVIDVPANTVTGYATLWALAVHKGIVYAGGEFTSIGAQQRQGLAGFNDGTYISTAGLPVAIEGASYTATLNAQGTGPFTWSIVPGPGSLPPGLTLNPDGTITGTPDVGTGGQAYTFDVLVTDNGNGSGPPSNEGRKTLTLYVAVPLPLPFSTGFETGNSLIDQIAAGGYVTGNRARLQLTAAAANTGSIGLQLDGTPGDSSWTTTQTQADTPTQWPGDLAYDTALEWALSTTGATALSVSFDWKAIRPALTQGDWYANLIFEVNDSSGWRVEPGTTITSAGTGATWAGVFRANGSTTTYTTETFQFSINPSASVLCRVRWLVKYASPEDTFPAAIYVDNMSIDAYNGPMPPPPPPPPPPPSVQISTSSLPTGVEDIAYGPVALAVTGGAQPYTWNATGLPAGLSIVNGNIQGTPATGTGGVTHTISITVTDAGAGTDIVTLDLVVNPQTQFSVTTTMLPSGQVDVAYGPVVMGAMGGTAPYTWSATGLPAGIVLTPTGLLLGTPQTAGVYPVVLTATDSASQIAQQTLSLTVTPPSGGNNGNGSGGLGSGGGGCALDGNGSGGGLWGQFVALVCLALCGVLGGLRHRGAVSKSFRRP